MPSSSPAVPDLISTYRSHSHSHSRTRNHPQKRRQETKPETEPALETDRPKPDQFLSPRKSTPTAERATKRRKTHQEQEKEQEREKTEIDVVLRPPGFWDNLTHVPLVRCALLELDRRNSQEEQEVAASLPHLPSLSSAIDLTRYARNGGPDLSNLRGVGNKNMLGNGGRQTQRITSGRGISKPQGGGREGGRVRSGSSRSSKNNNNNNQSASWVVPIGRGSSRSRRHTSSRATTTTTKTKSSGPYDAAFKQHLVDWKVWPIGCYLETGEEPSPPDNLQDIIRELCYTDRPSLEPPETSTDHDQDQDFRRFRKAYSQARSEEPRSRTLDVIEGVPLALSSSHVKQGPVRFNNLLPLLPENLVPGNPDRVYGARPEKLDASVRRDMEALILPTTVRDMLCPNFIVHVKGPAGEAETANLQVVYDGALAARGMEALWAFGSDGDSNGDEYGEHVPTARTITCTFSDGVLRMYAVHCRCGVWPSRGVSARARLLQQLQQQTPSWPEGVDYVTTMVGSWLIQDRPEEFRRGAAAFRNGLGWARK